MHSAPVKNSEALDSPAPVAVLLVALHFGHVANVDSDVQQVGRTGPADTSKNTPASIAFCAAKTGLTLRAVTGSCSVTFTTFDFASSCTSDSLSVRF